MKRLIILFAALIFSAYAWAGDVTLRWDESPENDVVKYRVYRAEMSGVTSAAFQKVTEVTGRENTTYIDTVDDSKNWVWVVTAFDNEGFESGPSNVVEYYELTLPIPPTGLRKE